MSLSGRLSFGVDLITFFHPDFWGVTDEAAVVAYARQEPKAFWEKILDAIAASGVTGVELTFSPFNCQDAVDTYGSVEGFAAAMRSRGLTMASGFFAELDASADILDTATQELVLERAEKYAALISACGGDAMVIGLPMRKSPDAEPAFFVDLAYAQKLASFLNRLGALTAKQGVRLALHTEAHSVFSTARDVDLFMLLTDPIYVGFCPDAAHLVLMGADPIAVVERHVDRLVIAHWKDALGPMPVDTPIDHTIHDLHRPFFCTLGAGRVDWPAWARLHRDHGYRGWAILELDAAPDPIAQIKAGREFVENALLPIML